MSPQSATTVSSQTGEKPIRKSRFVVDGMASPPPSYNAMPTSSIQSDHNLHGLGVSSNGAELAGAPEIKRGRFSVKDTPTISSPSPASMKAAASEALLSPSRSLSPSPIEGTPDGVNIGGPLDIGSERKSRFEVHHSPAPPTSGASGLVNGTGLHSPVLSATNTRDSSQTRVSRFSVEPSQPSQDTSAVLSTVGTPNLSQGKRSRFQVSSVDEISAGMNNL
ncbi:hypothetical protein BC939DRAFT_294098 [Gamsiella multidivaricata]|uniref:uncharacterized protein n=1 Tax=Gamsiella multidivaricata TaxID=101098 RepID=UPI002220C05F|nr:uncharacterized protein BC939DRAFT_294098 [Gamsiella multidivaricata]KAI7818410.1 hypothetical protein BC939DRAFT_294098 [Gamsiella multidivaricata]